MNYATPVSVYGMLPAYADFVPGYDKVIYKNKRHDQVVSWDESYVNDEVPVSYMYIDSKPDPEKFIKVAKQHQLISGVFDDEFFKFRGESGRHFREYRNKFDKILSMSTSILTDDDKAQVLDLIKRWEQLHGSKKYRMLMHSSYDKRFFKISYDQIKDDVIVFMFKHEGKVVGYKVMERNPSINEDGILEFRSLLRKYDPSYSHLCLYIDLKAYMYLHEQLKSPFVVNVGASTGGVAKYKAEKFPVYKTELVWSYKNKVQKSKKEDI